MHFFLKLFCQRAPNEPNLPKALENHVYPFFDDLMPFEGIFLSATDFRSV